MSFDDLGCGHSSSFDDLDSEHSSSIDEDLIITSLEVGIDDLGGENNW